jgi:hypothetical protein
MELNAFIKLGISNRGDEETSEISIIDKWRK